MATADIIDFERLVAPFEGDSPAGVDLRIDNDGRAFYAIRDAVRTARTAERKLIEAFDDPEAQAIRPDWSPVLRDAPQLLIEKSKDLHVAGFYLDGLVRKSGYVGLRDGLRLVRELLERYETQLFPHPDPEDVNDPRAVNRARYGQLAQLIPAVADPLARASLTPPEAGKPLSIVDYRKARTLESGADEQKLSELTASGERLIGACDQALQRLGVERLKGIFEDITGTQDQLQQLSDLLDRVAGEESPSMSEVREVLDDANSVVSRALRVVEAASSGESTEAQDASAGEAAPVVSTGGAVATGGKLQSREQAFQQLEQIAAFFEKSEPHSPLAHHLRQAVRWGKMSLPELLAEWISDEPTRKQLYERIGIPRIEGS